MASDGEKVAKILHDFFPNDFLTAVKQELLLLPRIHKSNDLYDFYHVPLPVVNSTAYTNLRLPTFSFDLSRNPIIQLNHNDLHCASSLTQLQHVLHSQAFLGNIQQLSGLELTHCDVSGQVYEANGRLLCHDDDVGENIGDDDGRSIGRRLAFILYLVDEDYGADAGGQLEFFDVYFTLHISRIQGCTEITSAFNRIKGSATVELIRIF